MEQENQTQKANPERNGNDDLNARVEAGWRGCGVRGEVPRIGECYFSSTPFCLVLISRTTLTFHKTEKGSTRMGGNPKIENRQKKKKMTLIRGWKN